MAPITPYTEQRPWGDFIEFTRNISSTVKIIEVKKGQALSKQLHHLREEFWYVISGTGRALVGNEEHPLAPGEHWFIPKEVEHRIEAITDLRVLEIALGDAEENDIVRLEDNYGRVDQTPTTP